jgi:hypothetical protein
MRLAEAKIKQAILHAEPEIRLTALAYFADSYSRDQAVMPVVIRAAETFGRGDSFRLLRAAEDLSQTETSIGWLTGQLGGALDPSGVADDNFRYAVALILCKADPELLLAGHAEAGQLRWFPQRLAARFGRRLAMHSWDWDTGWRALLQLARSTLRHKELTQGDAEELYAILESLARHRDDADAPKAPIVLGLLRDRLEGRDQFLEDWMEPLVVDLAGMMRLEEAAPLLAERLHAEDIDLGESCITALARIGGDVVVEAISRQWPQAEPTCRGAAANVLENVHTDCCVRTLLDMIAREEDYEVTLSLGHALAAQLCDDAIPPVRQLVQGRAEELSPEERDLRYRLVAACTLMGTTFPEYEAWYADAQRDNWGWNDYRSGRIADEYEPGD